jgi:hypothetical protein
VLKGAERPSQRKGAFSAGSVRRYRGVAGIDRIKALAGLDPGAITLKKIAMLILAEINVEPVRAD